jgi:hypothetical protein
MTPTPSAAIHEPFHRSWIMGVKLVAPTLSDGRKPRDSSSDEQPLRASAATAARPAPAYRDLLAAGRVVSTEAFPVSDVGGVAPGAEVDPNTTPAPPQRTGWARPSSVRS